MEESKELAVAPEMPPMPLMALTPTELGNAQSSLSTWCQKKLDYLRGELYDLEKAFEVARESKWKTSGIRNQIRKAEAGMRFYFKIKEAIGAGYLVIPDFPIDVFAVRTSEYTPYDYSEGKYKHDGEAAQAAIDLPAGEGEYISKHGAQKTENRLEIEKGGAEKWVKYFVTAGVAEVAFPVVLCKPQIMEATRKAMGLRIFDEIGIVGPQRHRDPVVVGRVLDFRSAPQSWDKTRPRYLNFFIGWCMNWEML